MGRVSEKRTIYDFVFVPNDGFLNSNTPLLNDCELKLSFDRSKADMSVLKLGEVQNDLSDKVLEISNCFAVTEYISSEAIRRRFSKIETRPITYVYDNCDVTLKTLPIKEANIRIDNIRGGTVKKIGYSLLRTNCSILVTGETTLLLARKMGQV